MKIAAVTQKAPFEALHPPIEEEYGDGIMGEAISTW
jgi:hypothetical protein